MNKQARPWLLATAAILAGGAARRSPLRLRRSAAAGASDVRAGIDAWQAQNYDEAVRIWRPLADRGDADAQYNIAQAYFLGRGVPQNMNLAEQWYERAARQGHEEAQANYGLLLFQNGRRREAMPWIERAADRGDPRAQYVLGTALFNGDLVAQDLPRAYALMSRAAAQNLPPAITQLADDGARPDPAGPRPRRRAGARDARPRRRRSQIAATAPRRSRRADAGAGAACRTAAADDDAAGSAACAAAAAASAPRPVPRRSGRRRRPLAGPARRVQQRGQCAPRLGRGRRPAAGPPALLCPRRQRRSGSRPGRCATAPPPRAPAPPPARAASRSAP